MRKKFIFIIVSALITICSAVYADDSILLDDCVDLSVAINHSDGIYSSVIEEENRSAYGDDYTMFMREDITQEWVEYDITKGKYPVFYTYFRQNEEIAHFSFEQSIDGENWSSVSPQIKIEPAESWQWIPVRYTLKGIGDDTEKVRIKFNDKNAVAWSPMIAKVCLEYKTYNSVGFADCVGTPYDGAVSQLKNLGFVNGYNVFEYKPLNNVTRAEFAKINSEILNLGKSGEAVFSDIKPEHWIYEYLAPLYRQGIINGDESACFNPENEITYIEAAKMLVCSLGYTAGSEDDGGYPVGYIKIAQRLGLFDDITTEDNNALLNRGDMAIMICNALEADLLVQTKFGSDADFTKKGTLLSEYHGIEKISGIVNGANGMSLISDVNIDVGTAVIDENTYSISKFALSDFLGMNISAFVKSNDDTILYAESESNQIIDISADKYIHLSDGKIYYDNGSEYGAYVAVDNNTRIIYNGKYKSRIGVTDSLSITSGNMRIICNSSHVADSILITEYKNYIAVTDGKLKSIINDRISGAVSINFDKAEKVKINVYGEETDVNDAKFIKGDIISVATSEDGSVVFADIAASSIRGKVSYLNKNDNKIFIDSKKYEMTDSFKSFGGDIKAGTDIVAYPDINGRIFAAETSGVSEYAYITGCGDVDTFGNTVLVRVVLTSGKVVSLPATKKTKLDGISDNIRSIDALLPQLVKIRINSDKELSEIYTINSGELTLDYSSESCKYIGGAMSVFASKYQLASDTPVFFVPSDVKDISKYKVINKNALYTDFYYNIGIYNTSDEYIAGAAVVYENGSRKRHVDSYDEAAIIRGVEQIENSEGEPCLKLDVFIRGQESEIYFDNDGGEDLTYNWLPEYDAVNTSNGSNPFNIGEVIQYYSDGESHCRSFRMMLTRDMISDGVYYEKNTGDYGILNSENYFSELYTSFAKVEEKFSDKILISADGVTLRTIPIIAANVYVYEKERDKLSLGTAADISIGGDVFVRMVYADCFDVIVVV